MHPREGETKTEQQKTERTEREAFMREQRKQGSGSAKAGRLGEKLVQRGKNYNKKMEMRRGGGALKLKIKIKKAQTCSYLYSNKNRHQK